MAMSDEKQEKMVLCGANSYDMKYYFNEKFNGIPESVKNELHILCVLFTEEVGGIFTIGFDEEGNVLLETNADDAPPQKRTVGELKHLLPGIYSERRFQRYADG